MLKYKAKKYISGVNTPFLSFYNKVLTQELSDAIHAENKICLGATINLRHDLGQTQALQIMVEMLKQKVDILITDYPNFYEKAIKQLLL